MKKNYVIVGLVFMIFFVISFITNILNSILPDIKESFSLSLGLAGFLPFSFFIAYGVMSAPAGVIIDRYGEKKTILISFLIEIVGTLLFAIFPSFLIALSSLFLIGIGMAMLQVAINPLLRVSGGENQFAFFSVMAQLVFGAASAISPYVYSYLMSGLSTENSTNQFFNFLHQIVPSNLQWVSMYWVFFVTLFLIIAIVFFTKFPKIELKEDEKAGGIENFKELLKNKYVILFFIGIFAYVGTEQGTGNWISQFLKEYHGLSPEIEGAATVSKFWLYLTIGCFLGLLLLKLFDSRKILIVFASSAIISLSFALFGNTQTALIAFPLVGFFASVMWSIIFSLALNSVAKYHGSFSGILCTGIIGGAIIPLIIGALGDFIGLKAGMFFLYITLLYILSIGFWAKPIVNNKTISLKRKNNN